VKYISIVDTLLMLMLYFWIILFTVKFIILFYWVYKIAQIVQKIVARLARIIQVRVAPNTRRLCHYSSKLTLIIIMRFVAMWLAHPIRFACRNNMKLLLWNQKIYYLKHSKKEQGEEIAFYYVLNEWHKEYLYYFEE